VFHAEGENITFFYDLLSVHGIERLELFALLVTPFATQDLKNLISSFSPVIGASLAATFVPPVYPTGPTTAMLRASFNFCSMKFLNAVLISSFIHVGLFTAHCCFSSS
jgi:hypothetical protein